MRKALTLLPIVAIALVTITIAATATTTTAATVKLQADLSKAITVWEGSYVITVSWNVNNNRWVTVRPGLTIRLDESDISVIRSWGCRNVYVVITYSGIDGIWGRCILSVAVFTRGGAYVQTVSAPTLWTDYSTNPQKIYVLVPKEEIIKSPSITIGFPRLPQPIPNTRADRASLRIVKVQIAPVKTVNNDVSEQHSEKLWGWWFVTDVKKWILIGAGVFALIVIVAAIAFRLIVK